MTIALTISSMLGFAACGVQPTAAPSAGSVAGTGVESTMVSAQTVADVPTTVPVPPTSAEPGLTFSLTGGRTLHLPPALDGYVAEEVKSQHDYSFGTDKTFVVFSNRETVTYYVISTTRGDAVRTALKDPGAHGYTAVNGEKIDGQQVYIGSDPTATEVTWAIAEDEVVAVVGNRMTLEQVLAIAHMLEVTK